MTAAGGKPIYLLAAAMRAWDRQQALIDRDNDRDDRQRQTDAAYILQPPAPRGYGFMYVGEMTRDDGTKYRVDDFKLQGIDPDEDRRIDLERWRHDLELAVEAGLITQQEGEAAWQSANPNPHPSSSSSTGTTSTTAPTTTKTPSSTDSPSPGAGPPSPRRPKPGNRRSSSPLPWQPHRPAS